VLSILLRIVRGIYLDNLFVYLYICKNTIFIGIKIIYLIYIEILYGYHNQNSQ